MRPTPPQPRPAPPALSPLARACWLFAALVVLACFALLLSVPAPRHQPPPSHRQRQVSLRGARYRGQLGYHSGQAREAALVTEMVTGGAT